MTKRFIRITSRYETRCGDCGCSIPAGAQIDWRRGPYRAEVKHLTTAECDAARAAKAAAPQAPPAAPAFDAQPLFTFLTGAASRGLKRPKVRFCAPGGGEMLIYIARSGRLYVRTRTGWLYADATGVTSGPLANDAALLDALRTIAADPAAAAKAYGALTCSCSFCGLKLTDEGSVEVGYGPICADRFNLPHRSKGARVLDPNAPIVATPAPAPQAPPVHPLGRDLWAEITAAVA